MAHNVPAVPAIRHPKSRSTNTMETYQSMYNQSVENPSHFWSDIALSNLSWFRPFDETMSGNFADGDIRWFTGGKLNVSYNCIDRHLATRSDQVYCIQIAVVIVCLLIFRSP
jgi:acetyl-CoA synthetase